MRDAVGGVFNIAIIVVFIVVISGFLAFSVAYNKAFKLKNKIINIIETKEGANEIDPEIQKYMTQIGFVGLKGNKSEWDNKIFSGKTANKGDGVCMNGYCYRRVEIDTENNNKLEDKRQKVYYEVVTLVNIDIPILNRILPGMKMFQVSGTTSAFYER